jgi:hypothetical protein
MDKVIGYIGMVTGLLGSWFVASGDLALAGWLLFAVSNFAWVVQGTLTKNTDQKLAAGYHASRFHWFNYVGVNQQCLNK